MNTSYKYNVFISHSSKDKDRIRPLVKRLEDDGMKIWFDEKNIPDGGNIPIHVQSAIVESRRLILCMSPNGLGSEWVDFECSVMKVRDPSNKNLSIVPVLLEDCIIPDYYRVFKYIDFKVSDENAIERIKKACQEDGNNDHNEIFADVLNQTEEDEEFRQKDLGFLNEISRSIKTDICKYGPLLDKLIGACKLELADSNTLHEYIIAKCLAGNFDEIVRNIQSAFVDCFDDINEHNDRELNKLITISESLFSKLVLFNVRSDCIIKYHVQCKNGMHHQYTLPDMSLSNIEIVSSRQSYTIPRFYYNHHSPGRLSGGSLLSLEPGIKSDTVLNRAVKILYEIVNDKKIIDKDFNIEDVISELRETIDFRRQHTNLKLRKNYFILIPADKNSPLMDKTVRATLAERIPELSWIELRSENKENFFLIEDKKLSIAIKEFFETLEGHKSQ